MEDPRCEFDGCTAPAVYEGYTRSLHSLEPQPEPGWFGLVVVREDHKMCLIGFQKGASPEP